MRQGNIFKGLLPAGATYTGEKATHAKVIFNEGFTARDLIDELTISMIIIGLGFKQNDWQLQSTLTHIGVSSLAKIPEELQNTNILAKSSALAEATSSSTDALTAKKKKTHYHIQKPLQLCYS